MNTPSNNAVSTAPVDPGSAPDVIAIGLLTLEQRIAALDRLYNEEVAALSRELAKLKAEYVCLYHNKSVRRRRDKAFPVPMSRSPLA